MKEIKEQVEDYIKTISEEQINSGNIDMLFKLVDIHKDIENEEYWKKKEENMRYRSYGPGSYSESYGRRSRDSRGRYTEGGESSMGAYSGNNNYGRRGNFRGEEMMDEMYGNYQAYQEGKDQYSRGNYGAKEDTKKSLQYMLQSVEDFMCMLEEEADSQEEVEMIKKTAKRIASV